ncbi:hypothetical protein HC031_12505 [Planosporangium thailandense]|uniref:Cytochrome b561 bacterial/Ni-hydrogenase domain-containing protein n=1 Tax=Planosporangium thailandense TaxID=765197 RepID=A0ABX0XZ54_9ACTN|nr:hypothetical protein [Planosporangium thailandense]NJC70527.1 hypothetical protein [Planosporangium thailandense]
MADTLAEATGRQRRADAVLAGGGPAGNARLTAWTGLALLTLFLAELVTLLDVRGLISWHLAIGALLVPPALLKTVSTGWRIARYYTGDRPYRESGPPPLLLRVLGPLVVFGTLALLGSGLALIVTGPRAGQASLGSVLGFPLDVLTLHKAAFVGWGVVTGLHTLCRLLPALRLTLLPPTAPRQAVPGRWRRAGALAATAAIAAGLAVVVVHAGDAWRTLPERPFRHHGHSKVEPVR